MKRVLLITQYFYPENFKSNELVFELAKRGYKVDALVGIPNYPEGHYYRGYGLFSKRYEIINGVKIYRCFQSPRKLLPGGLGLFLNYFTFVISGCLWILFYFVWKKKYDCIIGHEPSPIFQAYPALLLRRLRNIPFYNWIMDLWPDAMLSGSSFRNKKVYNVISKLTAGIYKRTDKIFITSKPFRESICKMGNFDDRIVYFPNWSIDMMNEKTGVNIPALPVGFRIMLAGNLGTAQDLENVGRLMVELKDIAEIKWIFVGNGSMRPWLDSFIVKNGLENNAFTVGRYPGDMMPSFFKRADAMLVTLEPGYPHLEMVVPARLQSYMSAGRPVLAMIGIGGQEIIQESHCGYAAPAGDYKTLATIIRNNVIPQKESFEKMGKKGREYFEKNYDLQLCMDNLCRIIETDV